MPWSLHGEAVDVTDGNKWRHNAAIEYQNKPPTHSYFYYVQGHLACLHIYYFLCFLQSLGALWYTPTAPKGEIIIKMMKSPKGIRYGFVSLIFTGLLFISQQSLKVWSATRCGRLYCWSNQQKSLTAFVDPIRLAFGFICFWIEMTT